MHTNMQSIKKVKIHGMTSDKWTTKDKITQYKGLINLYNRDNKIFTVDQQVAQNKQTTELKKIQERVEKYRSELYNVIGGDKQSLRNALAVHRELQLAYQNSSPEKVIDLLQQVNFTKRKELDRLEYKMKLKSRDYVDGKVFNSILEDRLIYNENGQSLPTEKMAQIITGKVQEAILKKEAALAIRHTYTQMINIMKRDALYFDAILASIRQDGQDQGQCMITATKLGQLATEYLDDRREEFLSLEQVVRRDLASRKQDLQDAREAETRFAANLKNLLRRDSDINIGRIELRKSPSFQILIEDITSIMTVLNQLKMELFVPDIDSILPSLEGLMFQKRRLKALMEKGESEHQILQNKARHAEAMYNEMFNTMVDTTLMYKREKKRMLEEIKEYTQRKEQLDELIKSRNELLAKIRMGLKQLQALALLIISENKATGLSWKVKKPDEEEEDVLAITQILLSTFTKLMDRVKEPVWDEKALEEGYYIFESMIHGRTMQLEIHSIQAEDSLIDEGVTVETHILTREDIKGQSEEIVLAHAATDDM